MTASHHILKILTGPNSGAEAALPTGTYLLGSDSECDIILADSAVAPRHLELTVNDEAILARPLEGTLLVSGETVTEESVDVKDFTVLTIGGTHLCLGPSDSPWPNLSLPSLLSQAVQPETHDEHDTDSDTDTHSDKGTPLPPAPKAQKDAPRRRIPAVVFGVLFGVAVVAVLSLSVWFSGESSSEPDKAEKLQNSLIQNGLNGLKVEETAKGLTVKGLLDNTAQRELLDEILKAMEPQPTREVQVLTLLASSLQSILERRGARLRAVNIGGRIRISGYAEGPKALNSLKELSAPAFSHGVTVEFRLTDWAKLKPALETALRREQLIDLMQFSPKTWQIAVSGLLSTPQREKWQAVQIELSDMLQSPSPFFTPDAPSESRPLEAPVQPAPMARLSCGAIRVVTGSGSGDKEIEFGGKRYAQGTLLPGGYRIQEITKKLIVLSRKGHTLYCPARGK